MWQFMGSRAKGYGLERSWWVDDRQDPEKATRAAAHHLKDLYNEFGDWYLAMAAYNSGPGTVQSAVKRTGYADFWELYSRNVLPKETRNYVPIIVAVTIMAKNPAQYGLDSVVKEKPVPYDTVKIDYPIDLRLAAECVDATAEDFSDLNPSLLRHDHPERIGSSSCTCPPEPPTNFRLPSPRFPPTSASGGAITRCRPDETLASIARTYHTTPKAIAEANDLEDEPARARQPSDHPHRSRQADRHQHLRARDPRYKMRKGDTVESVAENFGVSAKMVRGWNHIKGSSLAGRKTLYVHLPVTRSREATRGREQASGKSKHHACVRQPHRRPERKLRQPKARPAEWFITE